MGQDTWLGRAVLLGVLLFVPIVMLLIAGDVIQELTTGWIWYLGRVLLKVKPDPWTAATAAVCLAGVVVGGQWFLGWVYAATGDPAGEPRRWPWRWTLQLLSLLVLMFVAGIATVGIVHQTGWLIRSPEPLRQWHGYGDGAARTINNLRNVGQAVHNFASATADADTLPVSGFDEYGRPMHSWQTHILPFVEQSTKGLNLEVPWNHPDNRGLMAKPMKPYQSWAFPSDPVDGYGVSHYAGNAAVTVGDRGKNLTRAADFPAGTANTIWAGEVNAGFRPWGDPLNARDPRRGAGGGPAAFGGPNPKRPALFAMCDASVRPLDPKALAAVAAGQVPE